MDLEHQCHELTDFQKGQIESLRYYLSHTEIASQLVISRTMMVSFLKRLDAHQSIDNLLRPGKLRKTSVADDRYIVHTAELHPRVPLAELHVNTGINVWEQTLR